MTRSMNNACRKVGSASNRAAGFTMIEMIIYLGFIGTVLFTVVLFSADFLGTGVKSRAYSEVNWNARFAVGRIASEIREARSYEPTLSTFGTDSSVLVLRSADPADELETVQLTGGAVTVTRGAGSPVPLTSGQVEVTRFRVEDLSFDGRSRNLRVLLEVTDTGDVELGALPVAVFETTERVRRLEGFEN